MSIQCLNFAINFDGNITTTEKFILVILANYCDEQHRNISQSFVI